jgi:hypothetical protein
LGRTPPVDVVDQINAGGLLITTQAIDVCEVCKTRIRRWMAEAEAKGQPLGVHHGRHYGIAADEGRQSGRANNDQRADRIDPADI